MIHFLVIYYFWSCWNLNIDSMKYISSWKKYFLNIMFVFNWTINNKPRNEITCPEGGHDTSSLSEPKHVLFQILRHRVKYVWNKLSNTTTRPFSFCNRLSMATNTNPPQNSMSVRSTWSISLWYTIFGAVGILISIAWNIFPPIDKNGYNYSIKPVSNTECKDIWISNYYSLCSFNLHCHFHQSKYMTQLHQYQQNHQLPLWSIATNGRIYRWYNQPKVVENSNRL
jgi:hypothetical protein